MSDETTACNDQSVQDLPKGDKNDRTASLVSSVAIPIYQGNCNIADVL